MVLVQLNGGLGNQLFQYAAAKSLSLHHNVQVKVDLSLYENNKERKCELDSLNIPLQVASKEEIGRFTSDSLVTKIVNRLKRKVYREPAFHFNPDFFKTPGDVYLKGYWQSEKYFSKYWPVISHEFSVKSQLVNNVANFAAKLRSENSVAVHIRRGDYLNSIVQDYHGILDWDYYDRALKKFPDARFYFFSDDIEFVKAQLQIDMPYEFVSGTKLAIEDFYLMSQCRHNIIANSSFSWWAAYINNNPEKTVIAPQKWFNKAGHNTEDLIPPGWQRV